MAALEDKYHPVELEDLASLAKLSYGFEEAPFPLFSFPYNGKWLMGVFMNFNEEGASYLLPCGSKRHVQKNHF